METKESRLEQLLDSLRTRLLIMGAQAEQALAEACNAVMSGDVPAAQAVLDGDADIDALENEIDEASFNILVRTQPVARDLRFIMSAVRMVQDLERIGDECVTIAERVVLMEQATPAPVQEDLRLLMDRSRATLAEVLRAFRDSDSKAALEVSRHDDEEAQIAVRVFQNIIDGVQNGSVQAWSSMHVVLITRALDRICRRAENIAEHTWFMVEGLSLKHKRI